MLHAVGQGALGVECREDDKEVLELLRALECRETRIRCEAERAFMRELEGGCSVPLGVWTELDNDNLQITGAVSSLDGQQRVREQTSGTIPSSTSTYATKDDISAAQQIGRELAAQVIAKGGREILAEARKEMPKGPLNLAPALQKANEQQLLEQQQA